MSPPITLNSLKIIALVIVLIGFSYVLTRQSISQLPLSELYTSRCEVQNSQGSAEFSVYMPTNMGVVDLASQLCNSVLNGSSYKQVVVSWQPRELLNTDAVLKQTYNVMLNREYALTGLLPNWREFYKPLLAMPAYQVFWYSHQQNFTLSAAFLKGKRIGLLEDKKSESGYLAPLSELRQQGLTIADLNIDYYPNRESVLNDFLNHKLDVITSVTQTDELANWPADQKKRLNTPSSGVTWFLSLNTQHEFEAKLKPFLSQFQQSIIRQSIERQGG